MVRKFYKKHQEKINYLLVGGWNTLFGYLTFALLYLLFKDKIHYLILLIISNILSITNAYVGYKAFVFRTSGNYLQEYLRFYVVYGGVLVLNFILLPFCVEIFRVNPLIAQGGLIFLNVIFSYLGHKNFSFKVLLLALLIIFGSAAFANENINLLDNYYAWMPLNAGTKLLMTRGGLKIISMGEFPAMVNQRMLSALLSEQDILIFEMKINRGKMGNLYWANYQDQRFVQPRSVAFYLGKPQAWKRYYINIAQQEKELGRVDYVLLNPFSGAGEAEIREIRFIKANWLEKLLAGWQEFWGPKGREVVGYTINTMPSPSLFGQSIYYYIYWTMGILSLFIFWFRRNNHKQVVKNIFMVTLIFWAWLEFSTLYSNGLNLKNDLPLLGKSLEQKRVLVNAGDFYAFIRFCEKNLPPGVPFDMRIPSMYNDIKAAYYLYPHEYKKGAEFMLLYDLGIEKEAAGNYAIWREFRKRAQILKKK